MRFRITLALAWLLVAISTPGQSQAPASLDGTWSGTATLGRTEYRIELEVKEAAGNWRFMQNGSQARSNPCLGIDYPVTVISKSESEMVIRVDGAKVLQGCPVYRPTLRSSDGKSLEGTFANGQPLSFTRK